jgi:hypothetical protein
MVSAVVVGGVGSGGAVLVVVGANAKVGGASIVVIVMTRLPTRVTQTSHTSSKKVGTRCHGNGGKGLHGTARRRLGNIRCVVVVVVPTSATWRR